MDELLGKKVPFSAQAEQAVIGSVLIDPDCIPSVMERLRADEFYGKLNRDIYDTVYSMFAYGMTVDPVTVLGWNMPPLSGIVRCFAASEKLRMRLTASSTKAAEKPRPRWKRPNARFMRFGRGEMSAD